MPHGIELNESGEAYAFFASNTPAWHRLGHVLKTAPDMPSALKMANPFTYLKCDAATYVTLENGEKVYQDIDDTKFIMRSDGKYIGRVGPDYHLQQPGDVAEFLSPYVDSGLVELEAGGTLCDGKRFWLLCKVKGAESDVVPGDTVKTYLLAATSFDGSLAQIVKGTGVRVVCANTLALAQRENAKLGIDWRVRHTKSMTERMKAAQTHVQIALETHAHTVEAYKTLARKPATERKLKAYVQNVILGDTKIDDASTRSLNILKTVEDLLEGQIGLDLVPAARGTMWQGYNAVTQYLTFNHGRTDDARVNNQWFGPTADTNSKALQLALAA